MKANSQPLLLAGPMDQYGAELLKSTALPLLEADGDVTFDFSEIDRMHAACLQVLLALQKDLEPKGRKVILQSVDPAVRKLFRISGTEDFFRFAGATP